MSILNPKIVICGTDTDIGKTIVSCLLVQGLNGIYWKPIQSGLEDDGDTGRVCKLLNLTVNRWIPEIYKFNAPVSPHWAAEKENRLIDKLEWLLDQSFTIVKDYFFALNRSYKASSTCGTRHTPCRWKETG